MFNLKIKHFEIVFLIALCLILIFIQVNLSLSAFKNEIEEKNGNVWRGNLLGYDEPQYWSLIRQYNIYKTLYIQDPYGTERDILFFPYFYVLSIFGNSADEIILMWHILRYAHIIILFVLMYLIAKKLFPKMIIPFFVLSFFAFGFDSLYSFNYLNSYFSCKGSEKDCMQVFASSPFPLGASPNGDSLFSSLTVPYYSFDYILFFVLMLSLIKINLNNNFKLKIFCAFLALFSFFSHPYYGIAILLMYVFFLLLKIKGNITKNLSLILFMMIFAVLNSLYLVNNSQTYSSLSPIAYLINKGMGIFQEVFVNIFRGSGFILAILLVMLLVYCFKKRDKISIKNIFLKLNQNNNFIYLSIPAALFVTLIRSERLFIHLPLVFLICAMLTKIKNKKYVILLVLTPILFSVSTAVFHYYFVYYDTKYVSPGLKYTLSLEIEALKWFSKIGSPEEYVFSDQNIGLHLPYLSGKRVYIGHFVLVNNQDEKFNDFMAFFANYNNETLREQFFVKNNITYMIINWRVRLMLVNIYYGIPVEELVNTLVIENNMGESEFYVDTAAMNILEETKVPIKVDLSFYKVKNI